jgi:parallel beta-helix repeat protein
MKKKIIFNIIVFSVLIFILNPISTGLNIKKNNNINPPVINHFYSNDSNILYVGGSGPNNYTNINDAIEEANDNDTIFVYSGIYYEYIRLYKSLKLIGENKENTIINCKDKADVIKIYENNILIKGFTIEDAGPNFWLRTDAGIEISNKKNNITIEDNIISKGYCGVLLQESNNITIKNNFFHSNNGPSIWLSGVSENNIVDGNIILRKLNENGGGIWIENFSPLNSIKNNKFTNCGIFIFGSSIEHFSQEIEGNLVNNKPLFYLINENNVKIPDEAINIILVNCSNIEINEKISKNIEVGILLAFCSNITISNSNFSYCNGGIGMIHVNSCMITNNNISNVGDAIIMRYSHNNIIRNNYIKKANRIGIEVIDSNENYITNNTISTNFSSRNIEVLNSYDNHIYYNNFFVYKKVVNYTYYIAVDTGWNLWDDGELGNYWWDYEEKNLNAENNGIVYEESYKIAPYDLQDNYPLVKPIGIFSNPPNKPSNIEGSKSGGKDEDYYYKTSSFDSDGDEVYYLFDWGDRTNSGWIGPFDSEEIATVNKTWEKIGFYQIRVKAKDIYGFESDWSESLRIIIPKNKQIIKLKFIEFLQNLFKILN